MNYYITTYALTTGIKILNDKDYEVKHNNSGALTVSRRGAGYICLYTRKEEWFTDREEAIQRAEQKRQKKLVSLEKQITRMKAKQIELVMQPEQGR